jgi:LysM repeat protein
MLSFGRTIRTTLVLGTSALALSACVNTSELDWDLRGNGGDTTAAARQATAPAPLADANGIISYPDYQMAAARRGETVATMAGRLGLDAGQLAQKNAVRPTDPLREGELLLLPTRVAAAPQPATVGGGSVDVAAIATTALDEAGPSGGTTAPAAASAGTQPLTHRVARGETAFTIARAYNVSAKALADWNQLGADMAVREGQTLIIPIATASAPDPEPEPTPPGTGSPTPEPPSAAKPLPDEDIPPASETALAGTGRGGNGRFGRSLRHAGAGQDHPRLRQEVEPGDRHRGPGRHARRRRGRRDGRRRHQGHRPGADRGDPPC